MLEKPIKPLFAPFSLDNFKPYVTKKKKKNAETI